MADPPPKVYANFRREASAPAHVYAQFSPEPTPKVYATFKPEIYEEAIRAAVLVAPPAPLPAAPLLSLTDQLLSQIRDLLLPDNWQNQQTFTTAQVLPSVGYDYRFLPWVRHFILTNRSASSNLYYWFDKPFNGGKVLPQNFATLTAGQSVTENADYNVLTVFADAASTDQAWEIRFMGYLAKQPGPGAMPIVGPA